VHKFSVIGNLLATNEAFGNDAHSSSSSKITGDLSDEDFEKLKTQAKTDYGDVADGEDDKGYRFKFNIDLDGMEVDNDIHLYGGEKDNGLRVWISMNWTPDAFESSKLIQYISKLLNKFKAALESVATIE